MLSRDRNGYTAAQVEAALHAPARVMAFRYELYDKTGGFKRHLSSVLSGVVEYNALAEIKRTAKFELEDTGGVDFLTDRIKPVARLRMTGGGWVEWPLGMFMMATAPRRVDGTGRVYRGVEAYDLAQILVDDKVTTRYTVSAGANVVEEVRALLEGAGITVHNITRSSKTLPAPRDWDRGTSKLTIINDLLRLIVYDDLHFDGDGTAIVRPYVSPDQRASEYTYKADGKSVVFPDAEQSLDLWGVPNHWVLVVSESDTDVMVSEYTNANANSPTSTTNLGRTIVHTETVDADSQASLDEMVRRKAFEDSQVYDTVQMGTAVMPFHAHRDVFTLDYSPLTSAAVKYEEVMWAFELNAKARMKHIIRRIVTV